MERPAGGFSPREAAMLSLLDADMLPVLATALVIFGTGFGCGYVYRHQISVRRRRDVARRSGVV
jgi:hypothetical protein